MSWRLKQQFVPNAVGQRVNVGHYFGFNGGGVGFKSELRPWESAIVLSIPTQQDRDYRIQVQGIIFNREITTPLHKLGPV